MKLTKIIKSGFMLIGLGFKWLFNAIIILLSLFNVFWYRVGFKRGYNKAQADKIENAFNKNLNFKKKIEYEIKPKLVNP